MTEEEKYMKEALRQAKKAEKLGEVPIGCVIVKDGKIIARGYASNRHIIVLINDSITESPKAFKLVLSEIAIMLSSVKLPVLSVKA